MSNGRAGRRPDRRVLFGALVAAAVLLLALANAHLLYVAITSQPECVAHAKVVGGMPGSFRAAKPAC